MALRWQSPVYLQRERLLSLLPEEPGFVVLLEAPAGFGKSVLAGQLAGRLGIRTLWASAHLGEVVLTGRLREVFALLLLGLPREEIAFLLWPDLPEAAALNNLSVWLSRLRKALEPWGASTYLREEGLGRVESDLMALEAALDRKDAEEALKLYQEPLFPGVDLPLADRKREEVHHRLRMPFLKQEDPRYQERLLELDPLDEEALLPLVEKCLKRGQKGRALRALQAYEKRLWEELREKPSSEVEALRRRLWT